jgi:hypothetical protein
MGFETETPVETPTRSPAEEIMGPPRGDGFCKPIRWLIPFGAKFELSVEESAEK